jgi:hypothetical protein
MKLILARDTMAKTHTFGKLTAERETFQTIERPWIPSADHLGGTNLISCVPAGTYELVYHDSEMHPHSFALVNPLLGVWHLPSEVPAGGGRSTVLLHPANRARELLGCIAIGMERQEGGDPAVLRSRLAFEMFNARVPWALGHTLTITEPPTWT